MSTCYYGRIVNNSHKLTLIQGGGEASQGAGQGRHRAGPRGPGHAVSGREERGRRAQEGEGTQGYIYLDT